MSKKDQSQSSEGSASKCEDRRQFMKLGVAGGLGICAVGTTICAGARAVLAPAFQEGQDGKSYRVAALAELTEKPIKVSIIDDKRDAWTVLPNQQIGSVYLRKSGEEILAIHSLCPHAGCMVLLGTQKNPKTGADEELFYCPCHVAHFDLDGGRLDEVSPSPRDLDTLDTEVDDQGNVFVKFQNFAFGIPEKRS